MNNDEKIIEKMIDEVEKIVKESMTDNLNPSNVNDRKSVSKEIIKCLEKELDDENN